MGAVSDFVEDTFDAVGDAVGSVVEGIGDVVTTVVDKVVEPVAKAVSNTIESAFKNPLATLARVAAVATGQFELLPLIGAADVAAHGGDFGDMAKAAAISYVAGQAGAATSGLADSTIAGGAAAGVTSAALRGGDMLQGAVSGALNTGFNQAIDSAATAINTPTPNTDDLSYTLPEGLTGGLDQAPPVEESAATEPSAPSDELTSGLDQAPTAEADYNAIDKSSWDVKPADYSPTTDKSNIPTSEPGLNPAGSYSELTMDSVQGQAPGLASMGGGSGLSIDASAPLGDPNSFINAPEYNTGMPQGTVSAAGFIDQSAMPALGDPTSFINNPAVTGQPVIPTPACAYNVNLPNVNIASLLNQNQARQNRALCLAFGGFDMNIPWLNTKAQMLNARPANVGCASTSAAGAQPGDLTHIYDQITPELRDVFASKGIGQPTPSALGFAPLTLAEGGSAACSTTCSTWGAMSKYMPKFYGNTGSSALQTVKTQRQAPGLGQLKQMYGSISQQGNMGGMARGGLPSKYHEAMPDGHNPEFVTGLTGYYAGGRGTGQSDDIPAMLHDGDYVIDAEAVSALGDGSSKAGKDALTSFLGQVPHKDGAQGKPVPAKIADGEFVLPEAFVTALGGGDNKRGAQMLDTMRERLRAHKRSAPTSKIPPKALSPLDYLKKAK